MDEPRADALRVLPEALAVGQEFVTFQDFKAALDRWAVAGRFEVRFKKSDRKRNVVGCKDAEDCVFHVRAMDDVTYKGLKLRRGVWGEIFTIGGYPMNFGVWGRHPGK
jgi:hypothetical protein